MRNIEEEVATELHRAISGELLHEEEMDRGPDEIAEEAIFRVTGMEQLMDRRKGLGGKH